MTTTTTTIYRTHATATLTVSTVLVRDGRDRFYETTIIVSGTALDGIRTTKKADAGFEHDATVAWARGYGDKPCLRDIFWTAAIAAAA